jgi:hypothetical protein
MNTYTQPENQSQMMDDIMASRIKAIDGIWYWTTWHVAYAQQGVDTSANFVTREDADTEWERRLAELRKAWGHRGAQFSETASERPSGGRAVRFRSIRKNGKPGTLTGVLYMDPIVRNY